MKVATDSMIITRYCLACDLKNDQELIRQYEAHHKAVWPEIVKSIQDAGIESMEIYRVGNRLFMMITTGDAFSFEKKSVADEANPIVQQWERLMWNYQQALPWANPGDKWLVMEKVFELK